MDNKIHIILTADIHGNLLPSKEFSGLSGIKSYCRQNNITPDNSIYIDLGDILLGSNLAHYYSAVATKTRHPFLSLLELLNCKAFVPGNHDFNYGLNRLREIQKEASFPFLLANIRDRKSGESVTGQEYELFDIASSRITVIGLSGRAVLFENREWFKNRLEYWDEVDLLKSLIPEIRSRHDPDLIIVAYHGGLEKNPDTGEKIIKAEENRAVAMAENIEDLDILLTSHQHKLVNTEVNNCLLIQPGKKGEYFGHISIKKQNDSKGNYNFNSRLLSTHNLTPDPNYVRLGSVYRKELDYWQQESLCRLEKPVIINDIVTDLCLQRSILVDWLHAVQLQAGSAEVSAISVVNADFENIQIDSLRRGDIIDFFPYQDYPVVLEISGKEILRVLEYSYTMFNRVNSPRDYRIDKSWQEPHFQIYLFHLFSGISYEIDFAREKGSRVVKLEYDGQPLTDDINLKVVMSEYSYGQLKSLNLISKQKDYTKLKHKIQDLLINSAERREKLLVPKLSKWKLLWA